MDWYVEKNASKSIVEKSKLQPMSDWVKSRRSSLDAPDPPVSGSSRSGRFHWVVDRSGWWLKNGL